MDKLVKESLLENENEDETGREKGKSDKYNTPDRED